MEATIEEKLKALHTLQQIDSQIDKIKSVRGELPMEVADLEDDITGLETRIQKFNAEIEEFEENIQANKNKIKDAQTFIKKYEGQLTNVKNNREFDALNKEIEIQGLEIQAAEKRINEAKRSIDLKKEIIASSTTELEGRRIDLENKKKELNNIVGETEKEEQELMKTRNKAEKDIEERLLFAYNRIRGSVKNGIAVATVIRNSCSGCFGTIPLQMQSDIRQHKRIIICEHCGRILVDTHKEEEEEMVERFMA
ncbi:MAG: zinc ribbon domain-containing protein [Bacteroidota bacterium]